MDLQGPYVSDQKFSGSVDFIYFVRLKKFFDKKSSGDMPESLARKFMVLPVKPFSYVQTRQIRELYLEFGRKFDWLPLFVGAMRGDIKLLERCLDLGSPIDQVCTSDQVRYTIYEWNSDMIDCWNFVYMFHRPIHMAITHRQLDTV
ncbi:hypothetical protein EDB80DRAFT_685557 [Ilyonectria destructans]|nr:hypothetical protein EDB80DRAFT_685557 [Ilyonectria destructans]